MKIEMFESVAKTNTTRTDQMSYRSWLMFESVAKTNTTRTILSPFKVNILFESVAKTNTTRTSLNNDEHPERLRVLLKQIQHALL